jgi:very-short-patch-repair endonuclease
MGSKTLQSSQPGLWALAKQQHGVVARRQMIALGFSSRAIMHRLASGRIHSVSRGVYAVGRPELTTLGRWMVAVLSCGPCAVLSHRSAAALWGMLAYTAGELDVSVPLHVGRRRTGINLHRRPSLTPRDVTTRDGIPVTTPVCTLVDIAAEIERHQLEAAINEADKRDLTTPVELRAALEGFPRRSGLAVLRQTLDRQTFTLTDSALERLFLPIARRAGLSPPQTGRYVNGFKVDFYWPDLRLVVETDGLRYHRTPGQQTRDRLRDNRHAAAGLTPLRFVHAQVRYDPGQVEATLSAVATRLRGAQRP